MDFWCVLYEYSYVHKKYKKESPFYFVPYEYIRVYVVPYRTVCMSFATKTVLKRDILLLCSRTRVL